MDMQVLLDRYADLILTHGVSLKKDDILNIAVECIGRDFAVLLTKKAYEMGAKAVYVDLIDSRIGKLRINKSKEENLSFVLDYEAKKYDEFVDKRIANIRLICPEDPDILNDEDPKRITKLSLARNKAAKRFYEEGIGQSKMKWCIAAMSSPKWGKKVFPTLTEKEAEKALWEDIFKICMVDKEDCLELWTKRDKAIKERVKKLQAFKVKELHFVGPETDLYIGLSPKAKFGGGSERTDTGIDFEPNIPSEEIFTTPDYRTVRGTVKATRPVLISGKQVKGLKMTFTDGVVTDFDATEGKENFASYIKGDTGSSRLGEVALVSTDSPIFQSGHIFEEILFDENAACHIALGNGFEFCIEGSDNMTEEELANEGFNKSSFHTDIMISSPEVDVIAETRDGKNIPIIEKGKFVI